jgi:thiosulfate dehydrogenase
LHLKEEDKEMKAMIAYIEYIGKDVPKGEEAKALGFMI